MRSVICDVLVILTVGNYNNITHITIIVKPRMCVCKMQSKIWKIFSYFQLHKATVVAFSCFELKFVSRSHCFCVQHADHQRFLQKLRLNFQAMIFSRIYRIFDLTSGSTLGFCISSGNQGIRQPVFFNQSDIGLIIVIHRFLFILKVHNILTLFRVEM